MASRGVYSSVKYVTREQANVRAVGVSHIAHVTRRGPALVLLASDSEAFQRITSAVSPAGQRGASDQLRLIVLLASTMLTELVFSPSHHLQCQSGFYVILREICKLAGIVAPATTCYSTWSRSASVA
jgi:hypothetical protein